MTRSEESDDWSQYSQAGGSRLSAGVEEVGLTVTASAVVEDTSEPSCGSGG